MRTRQAVDSGLGLNLGPKFVEDHKLFQASAKKIVLWLARLIFSSFLLVQAMLLAEEFLHEP